MSHLSSASVQTAPHPPSFRRELPNRVLASDSNQNLFYFPALGPSIESIGANYSVPAPSRFGTYDIYENRCYPGCEECVCQEYNSADGKCLKWTCASSGVGNLKGDQKGGFVGSEGFGIVRRRELSRDSKVITIMAITLIALVAYMIFSNSSSKRSR